MNYRKLTRRLRQLGCGGDYDPLIPPEGKYLAEHIKGARLITLPGVGHISMIKSPEQFNRKVIESLG